MFAFIQIKPLIFNYFISEMQDISANNLKFLLGVFCRNVLNFKRVPETKNRTKMNSLQMKQNKKKSRMALLYPYSYLIVLWLNNIQNSQREISESHNVVISVSHFPLF